MKDGEKIFKNILKNKPQPDVIGGKQSMMETRQLKNEDGTTKRSNEEGEWEGKGERDFDGIFNLININSIAYCWL